MPEETPEVQAACQLHLSALSAAEGEEERQGNFIDGGVHGGNNNFGQRQGNFIDSGVHGGNNNFGQRQGNFIDGGVTGGNNNFGRR